MTSCMYYKITTLFSVSRSLQKFHHGKIRVSNIVMTAVAGHMRPPMHNALVFSNLEYHNKYSAAESIGVSATTLT